MIERFIILALCGSLQAACVPAMVPKSPGVVGRVTNARTHKPIAGASVTFPNLNVPNASTDAQGMFDLPRQRKLGIVVLLPWEAWQRIPLLIIHSGYRPLGIQVSLYADHARIDATLTPQP